MESSGGSDPSPLADVSPFQEGVQFHVVSTLGEEFKGEVLAYDKVTECVVFHIHSLHSSFTLLHTHLRAALSNNWMHWIKGWSSNNISSLPCQMWSAQPIHWSESSKSGSSGSLFHSRLIPWPYITEYRCCRYKTGSPLFQCQIHEKIWRDRA